MQCWIESSNMYPSWCGALCYCQTSNIIHTKSQNFNVSRLAVVFAQSIKARCWVENEDVVGAAPTGDAPTTSEWSTILLPTEVWLILEVWEYLLGDVLLPDII